MTSLLMLLNAIAAVFLVIVILLQRSDDGLGGAFGAGGSTSLMSGADAKQALTKTTAVLAIIFMGSSLVLAMLTVNKGDAKSVISADTVVEEKAAVPAPSLPQTLPDAQ